jgi:hypothetical protein
VLVYVLGYGFWLCFFLSASTANESLGLGEGIEIRD